MTEQLHILGIAGSLRQGSYNKALLRTAQELLPEDTTLEIYERLGEIPHYNEDLRRQGYPEVVQDLRDRIRAADALLLAAPEYNHSVPGVLKNAIDWASRPPDQPLDRKPTALIGASTGAFGTLTAQLHLREICRSNRQHVVKGPAVLVMNAGKGKFDEEGRLVDETGRTFLRRLLDELVHLTRCLEDDACAAVS